MTTPKAILFDLGDTLLEETRVDLPGAIAWLMQRLGTAAGRRFEVELRAFYLEIRQTLRDGVIEFPIRSFLRLAVDLAGTDLGSDHQLEQEFWSQLCSMAPLSGVVDVLNELKQRGIPTGVVSNSVFSRAVLQEELKRNDLHDAFQFVISSSDFGIQKPHPMIFRAALRQAECQPNEAWFVGDNFDKDIVGATQVGMHAVWLNPTDPRRELPANSDRIAHWREFLPLLD